MSSRPRFATVVLDVDSTVAGVEGVDWLAALRGPDVMARCADLTRRAMEGEIPLEAVYEQRLLLISPSAAEIGRLARAYIEAIAPGCREAIAKLQTAGVRVVLISGGLLPAILPLAEFLKVNPSDVHAVGVRFTSGGDYAGFDASSPLSRGGGKPAVLKTLDLRAPVLAVGDGATDVEMKSVVDTFAAFTGFARREAVVRAAAAELSTFAALGEMCLRAR
jgi:phosphoserine phosphatase